MISFNDFIRSRNLKTSHFGTMAYEELVAFCSQRSISAPSLAEYASFMPKTTVQTVKTEPTTVDPVITLPDATVEIPFVALDFEKVKKQRKSVLQEMCDERNLEYDESTTKRQLISLLRSYENLHE